MDKTSRVVVTGMGAVTAIGCDLDTVWQNLLAGKTGIAPITLFDTTDNKVTIGAEVDMTRLDERQTGKLKRADRTVRFALDSARQALEQSGIDIDPKKPNGIGSIWGCGCGPAGTLYDSHKRFGEVGPSRMRPSTVPNCMANIVSANVSITHHLTGSNRVVASACTSSTNAIGDGFRNIRHGYADAVLCGGVDAFFDPFYYGVWNNLGVLSTIEDPKKALRPFDADRDGTLLGEGAAALLLESLASAEKRGATILGEVLGYGESSDATHITSPDIEGQSTAIRAALAEAEVQPEDIAYINAHATATQANDTTESRSIVATLGEAGKRTPIGAQKSYFGHTLGASGAIESVVTLLALGAGTAPPNLNLETLDPECEVTPVGAEPQELEGPIAMKNSFGFGGGNGVLVMSRFN